MLYVDAEGTKDSAYRVSENLTLFTVATYLFLVNQLIEVIFLTLFNVRHSDVCRFDCNWYVSIVRYGYDLAPHAHTKMDAANWAFFPFLPFVSWLLVKILNIDPTLAVITVSKLFFWLSIFMFMKMCKKYAPDINHIIPGTVVALNPYAIYANVGYTEPVFLFLSSLFFYLLSDDKYIRAGLVGAVLSCTRLPGVFTLLSYGIQALKKRHINLRIILGFFLIPLGLAVFMTYLYHLTGDALAFVHIQRAWNREFTNPLKVVISSLLSRNPVLMYMGMVGILAVVNSIFLIRKRMYDLAVFAFLCSIVPLSTSMDSVPRYMFWQVPVLFTLSYLISRLSSAWVFTIPVLTSVQFVMFSAWFSEKWWII